MHWRHPARFLTPLLFMAMTGGVSAQAFRGDGPPSLDLPGDKARAYYLYSMAQQARLERNFFDALKLLEEAVQFDDSADLNAELADFHASLNQFAPAEDRARHALGLDRSHREAREILARVLVQAAPPNEEGQARLLEAEKLYQDLVEEGAEAETYVDLADVQAKRGDLFLAAETLERYRAAESTRSHQVNLKLADVYRKSGRLGEAVIVLQEVVRQNPNHVGALDTLGTTLEDAGQYERAVEIWRGLVARSPHNPYAQYRLGSALLTMGQYRQAQEPLLTALRGDPRNMRLFLALGQAYEGAGELETAAESYRRALEQDDSSLEARFFLARVHQTRGEEEKALGLYHEILQRTAVRRDVLPDRAFYVLANSQIGMIHYLNQDYSASIAALEEALAASDRPADDLYLLLGRAYLGNQEEEEALRLVREGLEEYPDNGGMKVLQGELLLHRGKTGKARKLFKRLLAHEESSELAYLEVLRACLRVEAFREAEFWLGKAMTKHPDSRELQFQGAALAEQMGRFREAEERFRLLLRDDPDNAQALNYLGYMLADRGVNLEEALEILLQAVALDPENAAYLDSLGWVYYRLGRYEEAEEYLRRSAGGSRNDPVIYDHLGDVLTKQGKWQEALEAYQNALEYLPDNPEVIRKKIRESTANPDGM